MRKGEKRLFLSVMAILLCALILLIAQWGRGGNTPQIYHVSVLLDGTEGDYWKNFRAGMNQAAQEWNVDLRYITKYDGETTQADALRAEWEGEADGVVIVPVDEAALTAALKDAPNNLVVGVAGPKLDVDRVNCYISPDYADVGRRLAEAAVAAGAKDGCKVYMGPRPTPEAEQTAAALTESLTEMGVTFWRICAIPTEKMPSVQNGVLVAVESAMTETLCAAAAGSAQVVGVGVSSRLLHYLEDGTASALVVQSDYDAGYLAISRVAGRLARKNMGDAVLETFTATGENMFEEPMIDVLFSTY